MIKAKDDSSDRSGDPTGACRLVKGGDDFRMNLTIMVVYGKWECLPGGRRQ